MSMEKQEERYNYIFDKLSEVSYILKDCQFTEYQSKMLLGLVEHLTNQVNKRTVKSKRTINHYQNLTPEKLLELTFDMSDNNGLISAMQEYIRKKYSL